MMSMLVVGRGKEIQIQRYNEWYWDVLLEAPDVTWTELESMTPHCMRFEPDKHSYLSVYHAFGCFFAIENGYRGNAI